MTALIGFCSPSRGHSALCADDLEGGNPQRVDKISIAFGRFAAGATATAMLGDAIASREMQDTLGRPRPEQMSVEHLCNEAWLLVPRIAHAYQARVAEALATGSGEVDLAERWRQHGKIKGTFVILDAAEHRLCQAVMPCTIGELLDLGVGAKPPDLEFISIPNDHVFGFTRDTLPVGPIPSAAISSHREWARGEIQRVAAQVNGCVGRRIVGDLGASVETKQQQLTMWSNTGTHSLVTDSRSNT